MPSHRRCGMHFRRLGASFRRMSSRGGRHGGWLRVASSLLSAKQPLEHNGNRETAAILPQGMEECVLRLTVLCTGTAAALRLQPVLDTLFHILLIAPQESPALMHCRCCNMAPCNPWMIPHAHGASWGACPPNQCEVRHDDAAELCAREMWAGEHGWSLTGKSQAAERALCSLPMSDCQCRRYTWHRLAVS